MKDSYGRTIDYMRISITDHCNLRCIYCRPKEEKIGPEEEILTLDEIKTIGEAAAELGIRKIKITGGEPLVRKDCPEVISTLKAADGIDQVTLTTNGVLLKKYLKDLISAGVDGINISLDTMVPARYRDITGCDAFESVFWAVSQAPKLPIPIKVNAVSMEWGDNQKQDWKGLAELARQYPVDVRFIEMMPLGYGKQFLGVSHEDLLEDMKQYYPEMCLDERKHGHGPAVYYRNPGFLGSIGFISAIHGKFCEQCNRVRLTARGYLKTCLCYEDGVDLRTILREKKGKEALIQAMAQAIERKPEAHCFEHPSGVTEEKNMSEIGG